MNESSSSVAGWVIGIIIVVAIAVAIAVSIYREHQYRPSPVSPQSAMRTETIEVTLHLPSLQPEFQFTCETLIRYRIDYAIPDDMEAHRVAEKAVYDAAEQVSSRFQLNNKDVFALDLNEEIRRSRTAADGNLTVSAHCSSVTVDEEDLKLVKEVGRRKFALKVENYLWDAYLTRIDQLNMIFSDPKRAALWWFAKNPGKIDQLPEQFQLMHTIKRHLTNEGPLGSPYKFDGSSLEGPPPAKDLDDFLASADESDRAAMGNLLAKVYDGLGKEALAERARKLTEPDVGEPDERLRHSDLRLDWPSARTTVDPGESRWRSGRGRRICSRAWTSEVLFPPNDLADVTSE